MTKSKAQNFFGNYKKEIFIKENYVKEVYSSSYEQYKNIMKKASEEDYRRVIYLIYRYYEMMIREIEDVLLEEKAGGDYESNEQNFDDDCIELE